MDPKSIAAELATKGHALVPDFLTGDALTEAVAAIETYFPDPESGDCSADDVGALKHAVPFPFTSTP
jgi:hypothetical protein